jgi:DNA-binding IclR family transcriptional regulator
LAIIEHGTGIVLEEIQSLHVFRFVCNPGAYHALHAPAPAKAILATMPKVERTACWRGILLRVHRFNNH